jgi:hypothetical protein
MEEDISLVEEKIRAVPEVEETDRAVSAHGRENFGAPRECDVVHLLVVRNELRHGLLFLYTNISCRWAKCQVENCGRDLDIPDGAGGIDTRGTQFVGISLVPVKRG